MKIFFLLTTLTLLASCTQSQSPIVPNTPAPKTEMPKTDTMMKDDKMMKESENKMKEETMKADAMVKDDKMMKPTGYMSYDEAKVKEALANGQKVALFFHAPWCPSCRALDSAINSSLSSIPADSLIVKVDYDTSDAMKKKYGVTSQHTIVLIDKDMALVSKKLGVKTVNDVLN